MVTSQATNVYCLSYINVPFNVFHLHGLGVVTAWCSSWYRLVAQKYSMICRKMDLQPWKIKARLFFPMFHHYIQNHLISKIFRQSNLTSLLLIVQSKWHTYPICNLKILRNTISCVTFYALRFTLYALRASYAVIWLEF